jgi:hypothetical protein
MGIETRGVYGENTMHAPQKNNPRSSGGTIINILSALVFFGLLALGILWLLKSWGQAAGDYGAAMVNTSEKASALKCRINMDSIWKCIQTYSIENDSLPASREELVSFCGDSRVFRCDEPNGLPYAYIAGQRLNMPGSNVLVYEPVAVHQGRAVVLRLGGRIDMLDPNALKQAIEATESQIPRNR